MRDMVFTFIYAFTNAFTNLELVFASCLVHVVLFLYVNIT